MYRQVPAYNDAIEHHRFDCRYMGFIDTDEFIFVKNGQTLPKFLDEYFSRSQKIAGLGINWRMFGSAGKKFYEPIPVVERFTRRAADDYDSNFMIKTIANPRKILYMHYPHSCCYMTHCGCFDEQFNTISPLNSNSNPNNSAQKIQLNHYYTKSIEEYNKKYLQGRADCDLSRDKNAALDEDLNAVEDTEFRDYCRNLKSMPPLKDHSDLKLLENISIMLKSELNDVEKILTCFFVVKKTNSFQTNEKYQLQDFLLDNLFRVLTSSSVDLWDSMMFVVNFPYIFDENLPASRKILDMCRISVPQLIEKSQAQLDFSADFYLRQIERYLQFL